MAHLGTFVSLVQLYGQDIVATDHVSSPPRQEHARAVPLPWRSKRVEGRRPRRHVHPVYFPAIEVKDRAIIDLVADEQIRASREVRRHAKTLAHVRSDAGSVQGVAVAGGAI